MLKDYIDRIDALLADGELLEESAGNIKNWLAGSFLSPNSEASLKELIDSKNAQELNNRFFRQISFGTGGMRGRTIGTEPTSLEKGSIDSGGSPEMPGVGSNMLNEYTVARATAGLFRYAQNHLKQQGKASKPKLVIAHDVRHFSRYFCELSASVWAQLGGEAYIFGGPRSTPQLSFAVRHLKATCGIVITASHNPPHDNGYKVYFEDGGQVVPPHDKGIIEQVESTPLGDLVELLEIDLSNVATLDARIDSAYVESVVETVIDKSILGQAGLRVVFTPIHGTGAGATLPAMKQLGFAPLLVSEQMQLDANFSTVASPNPENAEALRMATELAEKEGADALMGTDPDCDRMGVAVRGEGGKMVLLTGNQIGAMMADYRIRKFKEMGWIPEQGTQSVALIKTFVTSPLQDAIATGHGIKVVNTLTGFKWIGEKLRIYEEQLDEEMGSSFSYEALSARDKARLLQQHSSFYVFGGEESYGYLPTDAVRDKDGNAACLIFCELVASLKREGKTALNYLDDLYLQHGYHLESLGQIVYEGAAGAAKIQRILETYRSSPPEELNGSKVSKFTDFGRETIHDSDGKLIPAQDLYFVDLENGYRYGVRGSGTEPKIKFYLFGRELVESESSLREVKTRVQASLESLKKAILADAKDRAEN